MRGVLLKLRFFS